MTDTRDRARTELKRVLLQLLSEGVGLLEGVRLVASLHGEAKLMRGEALDTFLGVDSETDGFPSEPTGWDATSYSRLSAERDTYLESQKAVLRESAKELLDELMRGEASRN